MQQNNIEYLEAGSNTIWIIGATEVSFKNVNITDICNKYDNIHIKQGAFVRCTFSSLTLGANVKTIAKSAFKSCSIGTLTLSLDESATIERGAFEQCTNLTTLSDIAFKSNQIPYLGYLFGADSSAENSLVIPSSLVSVTNIGALTPYAFYGCSQIETIAVSVDITDIPAYTFTGCSNLASLKLFTSRSAQKSCLNITNIVSIGDYAFSGCLGITTIYHEGTTIPVFGIDAFKDCYHLIRFATNPANKSPIYSSLKRKGTLVQQHNSAFGKVCQYLLLATEYKDDYNAVVNGGINAGTTRFSSDGKYYLFKEPSGGFSEDLTLEREKTDQSLPLVFSAHYGSNLDNVKSLTITKDVASLNFSNFQNCFSLEEVIFEERANNNPLFIGANCFKNCPNLKRITINGPLETWLREVSFGNPHYLFENAARLTIGGGTDSESSITLDPDNLNLNLANTVTSSLDLSNTTTLPANTFMYAKFFDTLVLSNHETFNKLANFAFYNCTNLKTIEGGINITDIGNSTFINCNNLYTEGSDDLIAFNGWVFGLKDKNATSCYIDSAKHKYFIADAFSDCANLNDIYFNGSIYDWLKLVFVNKYANPLYTKNSTKIKNLYLMVDGKFTLWSRQFTIRLDESGAITLESESESNVTIPLLPFTFAGYRLASLDISLQKTDGSFATLTPAQIQVFKDTFVDCTLDAVTCSPSTVSHLDLSDDIRAVKQVTLISNPVDNKLFSKAFANSKFLTSVTFRGTVVNEIAYNISKIESDAFKNCLKLKNVYFAGAMSSAKANVASWTNIIFENEFANPMCNYERALTKVTCQNSATSKSGALAFETREILPYTFLNFRFLKTLRIVNNNLISKVDITAFKDCTALINIIPNDKETNALARYLFNCTAGKGSYIIDLKNKAVIYGSTSTGNYSISGKQVVYENSKPVSKIVANTLASNAFKFSTQVSSLQISNLTKIEFGALANCKKLTSLHIPFLGPTENCPESEAYLGYIFGAPDYKNSSYYVPGRLTLNLTGNNVRVFETSFYGSTLQNLFISGKLNVYEDDFLDYLHISTPSITASGGTVIASYTTQDPIIFIKQATLENPDTELTLSNTIKYIHKEAFSNQLNLKAVFWAESLLGIGSNAFAGCKKLTSLGIRTPETSETPDPVCCLNKSLREIGKNAFSNCEGVKSLIIPVDNNLNIKDNIRDLNVFTGFKNLELVELPVDCAFKFPTSVNQIRFNATETGKIIEKAFSGLTNLQEVVLNEGIKITEIEKQAFANCYNLTKFPWQEISDTCTKIGAEAFNNCYSLTSITLPYTLNKLVVDEKYLCKGCNALPLAHSYTFTAPISGTYTFISSNLAAKISAAVSFEGTEESGESESFTSKKLEQGQSYNIVFYKIDGKNKLEVANSAIFYILLKPDNGTAFTASETQRVLFSSTTEMYVRISHVDTAKPVANLLTGLDSVVGEKTRVNHYIYNNGYSAQHLNSQPDPTVFNTTNFIGERAFAGCKGVVEVLNGTGIILTPGSTDLEGVALYAKRVEDIRLSPEAKSALNLKNQFQFWFPDNESDLPVLVAYSNTTDNDTIELPPEVINNGKTYTKYSIGTNAFNSFNTQGIKTISYSAGYSSFEIVNIEVQAFHSCPNLETINLPNVNMLKQAAFSDCANLKTINFSCVESCPANPFKACPTLDTISATETSGIKVVSVPITTDDTSNSLCLLLKLLNETTASLIGTSAAQLDNFKLDLSDSNIIIKELIPGALTNVIKPIKTLKFNTAFEYVPHNACRGVSIQELDLTAIHFIEICDCAFEGCGLQTISFPEYQSSEATGENGVISNIGMRAFANNRLYNKNKQEDEGDIHIGSGIKKVSSYIFGGNRNPESGELCDIKIVFTDAATNYKFTNNTDWDAFWFYNTSAGDKHIISGLEADDTSSPAELQKLSWITTKVLAADNKSRIKAAEFTPVLTESSEFLSSIDLSNIKEAKVGKGYLVSLNINTIKSPHDEATYAWNAAGVLEEVPGPKEHFWVIPQNDSVANLEAETALLAYDTISSDANNKAVFINNSPWKLVFGAAQGEFYNAEVLLQNDINHYFIDAAQNISTLDYYPVICVQCVAKQVGEWYYHYAPSVAGVQGDLYYCDAVTYMKTKTEYPTDSALPHSLTLHSLDRSDIITTVNATNAVQNKSNNAVYAFYTVKKKP
jgi:hypothetical protein